MPREKDYQWLSGLTDGDGTFSFSLNNKRKRLWNCTFKIAASLRNWRILEECRKLLGRGSINRRSGRGMGEFRIRDRKVLRSLIVPLFRQYPLYSNKAFYFHRWCRALEILDHLEYTKEERDKKLRLLYEERLPSNYRAPVWQESAPTKGWVCGFLEAEGSFYICNKGGVSGERYVHSFGVSQASDRHLLEHIRHLFHLPAQIVTRRPAAGLYYKLESSNFRALSPLRSYFRGQFRGRKGLEHRIWERTFKWRGNNSRLARIGQLLRDLRAVPASF